LHIYLSPHHDDVCFSLGHCASRQGGCVVNIFTRSDHVAVSLPAPSDPALRVDFISEIRLREDEAFVRAADLDRYDLKLEEPSLIGFRPFDLVNLGAAIARTSETLIPFLFELLPSGVDPRTVNVYCPIGVGGHRDHLSTLISVRGAYDRLSTRCALHLYEDLHYASVPSAREAGLQRASELFAGQSLSSTVHFLSAGAAARKMRLVGLYASQHPRGPQPSEYVPASGLTSELHEIVWRVAAT
jgi:hypothetical protein